MPKILGSSAYKNDWGVFITWDEGGYRMVTPEGENKSDGPIGMIVLSPFAKGNGYYNTIHYDHSSFVRTIEEIFGLTPLLANAPTATDLSDLFK